MARPLVLRFEGSELPVALEKVDRSRLYGWVDREVQDEHGRPCSLVTLLSDGRTLAGKGGVASVMVSVDGKWLDRAKLAPVDATGEPITPVPSSFAGPVDVVTKATTRDVLSHDVRLLYHLALEPGALLDALRGGAIYTFPYSFRGGLQADVAFLLASADGEAFLALAPRVPVETRVTAYPLARANDALSDLRSGALVGAGVIVP